MAQGLATLQAQPPGYDEIEALIQGVDQCLLLGFSRLGQEQVNALGALKRALKGTPLGPRVAQSVDALCRMEFMESHFTTLAAARAALQGAQHDALLGQARAALGRPGGESDAQALRAPEQQASPPGVDAWMESARHWLMELALAGFMQLDAAALWPFTATLEHLHEQPATLRLGMFLTGVQRELMDALPVGELEVVPVRRWADLWTRGMIAATGLPPAVAAERVSGTFYPLGCDLRHHPNAVSAALYGLFALPGESAPTRQARLTLNSYKVDVVSGHDLWTALDAQYEPALKALAEHKALHVKAMSLLATGDLRFDGDASVGAAFDPLALAKAHLGLKATAPLRGLALDPLDRHPALISELVYMDDFKAKSAQGEATLEVDGLTLAVDRERVSAASPLDEAAFKNASKWRRVLGLLRFDAGAWRLQPLVLDDSGKKLVFTGDQAMSKGGKATIAVLQERAGKLLRKKS